MRTKRDVFVKYIILTQPKLLGNVTGADPGIFVRGGVQLSENVDKQKKKIEKEEERKRKVVDLVVVLSLLQKYGLNRLSRQLFTFKFIFR